MIRKIIILITILTTAIATTMAHDGYIGEKKLYYGAAYYPEAWPEEDIDKDIKYMKEMNVNVVRMAEFAWAKMEPQEGVYDFEWLHKIIDKLHANGIDVILGTPTATPPTWLAEKHPEIYRITEKGERLHHGGRRDCSYTSAIYNKYCRKICEKMAQEFGHKEGVIGWQTDNELTVTPDYSEETRLQWVEWLKEKYGTVENLNNLWNLNLWSQRFTDFNQVPMPTESVTHHISLHYAWREFTNCKILDFHNMQIEILRKHSDRPITHDGMPGQTIDYERLFAPLDYAAVNMYHSFEAYDLIQSNYDRMRGFGKGFHWLFETAPNNSGGGLGGNTWYLHQIPGSLFAAIWMNYASGAQGTMFWPWRQQWAGQEVPHGAIISAWGKPAANWNELTTLGQQVKKASPYLMKNPVKQPKAAIIFSHKALNGLAIEKIANDLRYYQDWTYRFYRPMADNYIFRDVIYPSHDFSQYSLLFMPLLPNIPAETQERMKKWVEDGGTLILGPMSGYRSPEWTQYTDHHTGELEEWLNLEVESFIPIGTKRREKEMAFGLEFDSLLNINNSEAALWSLALSFDSGKTLAKYTSGHHVGKPAIIESKIGKGKVIFLGTDPGVEAMGALLKKYAAEVGISCDAEGDPGVVIVPRSGETKGIILVNITPEIRKIKLSDEYGTMTDIITNKRVKKSEIITLSPFEVKVCFEKM